MFSELNALAQVIMVDLVLAGDNAIAVGLIAAGVEKSKRTRVIMAGVGAAVVCRIIFALLTVWLLKLPGVLLLGGLLLLWVCWRLFVDLRRRQTRADVHTGKEAVKQLTLMQAMVQVSIADISMSLDNVLAVAAIAREHIYILVFGLALSVVLMLVAATFIARILEKHPWIAYIGLAIIFYVAAVMIWDGSHDVLTRLA